MTDVLPTLGILGGGQLGKMLIQVSLDYHLPVSVLDPDPYAPCKDIATSFSQGSFTDYQTVLDFGQACTHITVELENVNIDALYQLQAQGKTVFPQPEILEMVQDKRKQKTFYQQQGFPTAPFTLVENREEVYQHVEALPLVHKLGREGYDGRGVNILKTEADISDTFDQPGLLEHKVNVQREISVLLARNAQGELRIFPLIEMVFHPVHNLVEYLFAPAALSPQTTQTAIELASDLVQQLNYVGIIAIEMFLTEDNQLLINEIAPRPHNSGHHTLRACTTSQFEQHLRAILNWPLGDPHQHSPAALINLLGAPGHEGLTQYEGLKEVLKISGVYPYLYGKKYTRPFRKMGHITVLDEEVSQLKAKVDQVKNYLKVISLPESV